MVKAFGLVPACLGKRRVTPATEQQQCKHQWGKCVKESAARKGLGLGRPTVGIIGSPPKKRHSVPISAIECVTLSSHTQELKITKKSSCRRPESFPKYSNGWLCAGNSTRANAILGTEHSSQRSNANTITLPFIMLYNASHRCIGLPFWHPLI